MICISHSTKPASPPRTFIKINQVASTRSNRSDELNEPCIDLFKELWTKTVSWARNSKTKHTVGRLTWFNLWMAYIHWWIHRASFYWMIQDDFYRDYKNNASVNKIFLPHYNFSHNLSLLFLTASPRTFSKYRLS